FRVLAASRGDDDELAAVDFVSGRRGIAGEGQNRLPEQLTVRFIEGAEFFVEVGCPDEHQAASGDDRTTVVLGSGVPLAARVEFGVVSLRDVAGRCSG